MGRFTQQELMNASKLARNSAAKSASSDEGGDVEAVSKPRPFEDVEHPFSGNDNNRRVAERIAKEAGKLNTPVIEIRPAHEVAAEDLDKADEMDAESGQALSEDEQNAQSQATIAAGLGKGAGAATVLKPLTPAQKKKADEAAAAAAITASAGGIPPVPVFNG